MPKPAFAIILLFSLWACGPERSAISGQIPSVSLKSYAGETFALPGDGREVTLLVFWATWCQPCIMEIPSLMRLHEKYRGRKFRVVSINVDDPEGQKVKAISENFGINYPILMGSDETLRQFGGIVALPTSLLVGRDGRIVEKVQGLLPEAELERKVLAALGPTG